MLSGPPGPTRTVPLLPYPTLVRCLFRTRSGLLPDRPVDAHPHARHVACAAALAPRLRAGCPSHQQGRKRLMQIGCFKEDGDGFAGRLRTLTLDVALRLVPTGFTGHDRAPDWRVHLADNGAPETIGPEVGSGWNHEDRKSTRLNSSQ